MFKKRCKNCNEKIDKSYSYCPSCGFDLRNSNSFEDWGLLGKDDSNPLLKEMRFSKGIDTLFKSLLKGLDGKSQSNPGKKNMLDSKKGIGISINISTNNNNLPKIVLSSFEDRGGTNLDEEPELLEKRPKQKNLKNFSNLPKEEPLTNIRRLTDKVLYEINLPGVTSLNDISINKLENRSQGNFKEQGFF